jgi:O-antigen/teichoic acid export membrane protein
MPTEVRSSFGFVALFKRFTSYLSGDSLNYLLGFAIYGWLVRVLTNQQYGHLSVATGIYQAFVMVVALGLDLIGPRLLAERSENLEYVVSRVQSLRVKFALLFCLPILSFIAIGYWHAGQAEVSVVLIASFSMVLARAFDVGYVAVALGRPKPLVYSRAIGLLIYLVTLIALRHAIVAHIWAIPIFNAVGVLVGRIQLMRTMHLRMFGLTASHGVQPVSLDWHVLMSGVKTSTGQLILFSFQTLDIILLNRYVDVGTVGQYAMVSRLYLFGTAVLTSLLNAFIPDLIACSRQDSFRSGLCKFVLSSSAIGIFGGFCFWLLGPGVTESLSGRPLHAVRLISPIYAMVFFIMSLANPFVSFLPSLQREKEYLAAVVAGAAVTLGADLVLIPRFGVIGAAWGQLSGTLMLGLYGAAVLRQHVMTLDNDQVLRRDVIVRTSA